MKTCETARTLILLDASGELTDAEKSDLRLHLDACPECRRYRTNAARLAACSRTAPDIRPPSVNIPLLDAQARHWRRRVLRIQLSAALSAAAAILLAVLGPSPWLAPRPEKAGQAASHPLTLLDEWQFWVVSYVGQQDQETASTSFAQNWSEQDFARHLLVLEGLHPEEETDAEEESLESTPGGLPPITHRGNNSCEPRRS